MGLVSMSLFIQRWKQSQTKKKIGGYNMEEIRTYTLEEVETILKVTRRTIYNYIKGGQLKAVKMGKYWRVPQKELEYFIEHGTAPRE